jgi:hypothetical protein
MQVLPVAGEKRRVNPARKGAANAELCSTDTDPLPYREIQLLDSALP